MRRGLLVKFGFGGMRYEAIEKDHISRFCRNRNKTERAVSVGLKKPLATRNPSFELREVLHLHCAGGGKVNEGGGGVVSLSRRDVRHAIKLGGTVHAHDDGDCG